MPRSWIRTREAGLAGLGFQVLEAEPEVPVFVDDVVRVGAPAVERRQGGVGLIGSSMVAITKLLSFMPSSAGVSA